MYSLQDSKQSSKLEYDVPVEKNAANSSNLPHLNNTSLYGQIMERSRIRKENRTKRDVSPSQISQLHDFTGSTVSTTSLTVSSISSNEKSTDLVSDEKTIDSLNDPKHPSEWWLYLQKCKDELSNEALIKNYTIAMQKMDYKNYSNNVHLVRIWINFIHLQISISKASATIVRKFFQRMKSLSIGQRVSLFYVEWAKFEILHKNFAFARSILEDGLSCNADPSNMLQSCIESLDDKENEKFPISSTITATPAQSSPIFSSHAVDNENVIINNEFTKKSSKLEEKEPIILETDSLIATEEIKIEDKLSLKQNMLPKRSALIVNGQAYIKLELLGRGGSSKVYKVLSPHGAILAIKRVNLRGVDQTTLSGYLNEIDLLKRMSTHERIIGLKDSEINEKGGYIHIVMECGEIDLAKVLQTEGKDAPKLNLNFIRVYWEQMLEAVQIIHEERVVHTDLKPANFLFVRGSLKLIDFGIAKAIQNDTTNIQRDHHIGTVNYMSPEAILDTNNGIGGEHTKKQCIKIGRQSDVWSLGCILYQMVYGKTPFSHLSMIQKLHKIVDPQHYIEYPELAVEMKNPFLLQVLKSCLKRDPKSRLTIPELLKHPFVRPDTTMEGLISQINLHDEQTKSVVEAALQILRDNPSFSNSDILRKLCVLKSKAQK